MKGSEELETALAQILPNETGANAGRPRQLPIRTRWATHMAQLPRSAA